MDKIISLWEDAYKMAERKKKVKETVNEEALNESIQSQDSEDVKAVFETKLNELLEMAKKKKNVIEDTEIIERLRNHPMALWKCK